MKFKIAFGLSILAPFTFALVALASPEDPGFATLKARAHRVFEYDKQHFSELSRTDLTALSFAIAFHNRPGTELLLGKLEHSIPAQRSVSF